MSRRSARLIAIYLPQFYPIPENDEWHGRGFTEWTNVAKAKPLFRGHYQPRLPADLGFYDLRVPEVREAQASMAREHGIEGFLYWHYWFGHGRRILERPFSEILASGKPDFPFCLGWANASWTGVWYGMSNRQLLAQEYPGEEDHERHFYVLLPAFRDPRYLRVEGRPIFFVYQPRGLPDASAFTDQWRSLAKRENLEGIHFVSSMLGGVDAEQRAAFEASTLLDPFSYLPKPSSRLRTWAREFLRRTLGFVVPKLRAKPIVHGYSELVEFLAQRSLPPDEYPVVVPNFDNTARCGAAGTVLHDSKPELFEQMVADAVRKVADRDPERRIIIVEAWNEWAEGNHLEPDQRYGRGYLEALRRCVGPCGVTALAPEGATLDERPPC